MRDDGELEGVRPLNFADLNAHGFPFADPPTVKPFLQRLAEPLRIHSQSSFHPPVARRKSIVEIRRPREVSHGEAIKPLERTRPRLAVHDDMNLQFARKHSKKV
jgi:hypothetical protein